ncbi:MAG: nuclear transport factor 2 family protein [Oscillospiraceae bacterium]|nr:nuclear transport factor 2 family protein [Oscillospiraceae bacterium]
MKKRERIITDYFNSWIRKDASVLERTFSTDVVYIESWGPAYRSLEQIEAWFTEWNKDNTVLDWNISDFYHSGDTSICEWYFQCECGGNIDGFNGVSITTFNERDEIVLLKEFQSKIPNIYPYE